jgi:hypothetical protein
MCLISVPVKRHCTKNSIIYLLLSLINGYILFKFVIFTLCLLMKTIMVLNSWGYLCGNFVDHGPNFVTLYDIPIFQLQCLLVLTIFSIDFCDFLNALLKL